MSSIHSMEIRLRLTGDARHEKSGASVCYSTSNTLVVTTGNIESL